VSFLKIMRINSYTTVTKTEYIYWNQGQNASKVFDAINKELNINNLPTQCEVQDVSLGIFKGSKKYLVVAGQQEELLIGISSQAYGDFLCVFVYLAIAPNAGSVIRGLTLGALTGNSSNVMQAGTLSKMNVADVQEMNMFWSSTVSCIEKALIDVGLTEQMRGFAGII